MTRGPGPWEPRHLAVAVAGHTVALLVVLLGWYGAAGRIDADDQGAWLALAAGGLAASGAVNGWWLRTWRIAARRARAELVSVAHASAAPPARPDDDGRRVVVVGGRLVHRHGCPLVVAKPVEPASRSAGHQTACGVCRP